MTNPHRTRSTARAILSSRRRVTILFTDVEGSTELWDEKGDLEGRLMVDRHNRLLFPLIRRFRGKVLKTIGDSLMASFKRPRDAVRAAIAIQQTLAQAREDDPDFEVRVRIGIHSGYALVEHGDVYGDVVNVAARIQARASGGQILLSTAAARGLDKRALGLVRASGFKPKGKRRPISLYCARWQHCENLVASLPEGPFLPVYGRQRRELAAFALGTAALLYFLYHEYVRYLLADSETLALLHLDPRLVLNLHPGLSAALGVVALGGVAGLLRLRRLPQMLMRVLQGGIGFAAGFALLWLATLPEWGPLDERADWDRPVFTSRHLFVEILENGTLVRTGPDLQAPVLRGVDAGVLLLLADVKEVPPLTWNQVFMGPGKYGFVARVIPARLGAPRKRLSIANKFVLTLRDAAALACGLTGFLLGVWRFRLRPA